MPSGVWSVYDGAAFKDTLDALEEFFTDERLEGPLYGGHFPSCDGHLAGVEPIPENAVEGLLGDGVALPRAKSPLRHPAEYFVLGVETRRVVLEDPPNVVRAVGVGNEGPLAQLVLALLVAEGCAEGPSPRPYGRLQARSGASTHAEPTTVLEKVTATEPKLSREVKEPGNEYLAPLLNEYRASWAILRQWAGHDVVVAEMKERIQQAERVALDAVYALQKAGLDRDAERLRRRLGVAAGGSMSLWMPADSRPEMWTSSERNKLERRFRR